MYIHVYVYIYIYIYIYTYIYVICIRNTIMMHTRLHRGAGARPILVRVDVGVRVGVVLEGTTIGFWLRPLSLLRLSLRFLDSIFPENLLWT